MRQNSVVELTSNPVRRKLETMQKTEKFFIFSWKELVVIALLVVTSLGFFFTLGLHYGKKIHGETAVQAPEAPAEKLEESPESVPPRATLEQGAQHADTAAKDAIQTATENQVKGESVKVEQPKPVDLPKEKGETAQAPVAKEEAKPAEQPVAASEAPAAASSSSHYAVQLGSYPSRKEAQTRISTLSKRGLKPEVMVAQVNGETRYRVILGGFKTKQLALKKGKDLHSSRKIENFVVIKDE